MEVWQSKTAHSFSFVVVLFVTCRPRQRVAPHVRRASEQPGDSAGQKTKVPDACTVLPTPCCNDHTVSKA